MSNFQTECFGLKKEQIELEVGIAIERCLMTILKIMLITVSVAFIMFEYEIAPMEYLIDCIIKSFKVLEKFQEEEQLRAGEYKDYLQITGG